MKHLYQLPKIITFCGVLIFAVVKFYLRDLNIHNDFSRFILNIYPNFLAGLMIPLLFLYKYEFIAIDRIKKFDIKIKCIMVATLLFLIYEEYRPTFGSSKTLDYWDMIFSGVGLLVFYMVYKTMRADKLNQTRKI